MNKNILVLFCSLLLISYSSLILAKKSNILFQSGTLINLSNGILDGSNTLSETNKYGDLGLGTVNGAKGEMVIVDGKIYLSDRNGNAKVISPESKTPFAMSVHFNPEIIFYLDNINSIDELEKLIDQRLSGTNYFYAIKIEGVFSEIKARSFDPQKKPYQPFPEWLKVHQHVFYIHDALATVVGCVLPASLCNQQFLLSSINYI